MPPKTRFLIELASFLADHPKLISQGPDWILASLKLGHEAPEEIRSLSVFVRQGMPHILDEVDIEEAIVEAIRLQVEKQFDDEEPITMSCSRPPPNRLP